MKFSIIIPFKFNAAPGNKIHLSFQMGTAKVQLMTLNLHM